ncbi:MAG: antibiotic biosynthesis monooxygenase family protein [Ignavibacteriaceae bacterium]
MFMRFLHLEINSDFMNEFKKFYEETVFPQLQQISGCLFAGLIKSGIKNNEVISLTFWETQSAAENYEKQGIFKALVKQAKPFLSESTEWKIHLSDNMELEYAPVSEEPVIKKYSVKLQKNQGEKMEMENSNMYVRIVSAKIQDGKQEEFKKIYSQVIMPELKAIEGCEYAYLIESINEDDEFISLTIWDNKEYANNYEKSGKFKELVNKIKHTFSHFYLWKMELEKRYNAEMQTSDDLRIEQYDLVTGKSFSH